MSLDPGRSTTLAVHNGFLGTGSYGPECMANVGRVALPGALGFIGVVQWEDGSSAPCRVLTIW